MLRRAIALVDGGKAGSAERHAPSSARSKPLLVEEFLVSVLHFDGTGDLVRVNFAARSCESLSGLMRWLGDGTATVQRCLHAGNVALRVSGHVGPRCILSHHGTVVGSLGGRDDVSLTGHLVESSVVVVGLVELVVLLGYPCGCSLLPRSR